MVCHGEMKGYDEVDAGVLNISFPTSFVDDDLARNEEDGLGDANHFLPVVSGACVRGCCAFCRASITEP